MQQPAAPTHEPLTPRWQRALAGFALGLVTVLLAVPVGLMLLLLWVAILGVASAQTLEAAGALRKGSFGPSVTVAACAMGFAALVSVGARLPRALRRRPSPTMIDGPVRPGRWLLRHPWVSAGLAVLATDLVLVPVDRAGVVDVHSVLLGSLLMATGLWLAGSLAYGLIRGWRLVLELVWAGVRRSSFFAGIVVVGSLAVMLGAGLLWRGVTERAAHTPEARLSSRFAACGPSAVECTRVALTEVAGSGRPAPQPTAAVIPPARPPEPAAPSVPGLGPAAAPEPPTSFDRCVEELHRSGPGFESARDTALRSAQQALRNAADAEDVVHGAIMSVCLGAERIADIRPYFLRSVSNAAKRQKKVGSRTWCPLDPADPPPNANQCIVTSVADQAVQEEMEIAAWMALCELEAQDRTILELRFWQNLSHAEVAARLQISEQTARKRYSRALGVLRERFKRRCD